MATKIFKSSLDLLCGRKKITDNTHYIYFLQEYIYVTNGNVALKQHMGLHGFNDADMRKLDGMCIHKDVFKIFKKRKFMLNISHIEVEVVSGFANVIRVPYKNSYEVHGAEKLLRQINQSFDTFRMRDVKEVAINPDHITVIRKVMVSDSSGFTFRFNEGTGGVLVTPNKNNIKEHAMIVPLVVTGELKDL